MKKVLLITHTRENESAAMVAKAIQNKGGRAIRLNTDMYPGKTSLTARFVKGNWQNILHTEEGSFHLDEFESLWYRRLRIGAGLASSIEEKYIPASLDESRRSFFGMLTSLDIFQLDDFLKVRKAEHKQLQLKVAHKLGLSVPATLITNDAAQVAPFFSACPEGIITKMQAAFAIYEQGVENVVYTNSLDNSVLDELDGLEFCPMTFQQKIEKKLELRITIVGKQVFTASIDSQRSELARNDWRKQGIQLINDWEKFDLPAETEQKLLKLMDHFGLNYGAIDMILSPEDELYFLEINPVGEFYWLENNPGFPVSEALADLLMGNTERR